MVSHIGRIGEAMAGGLLAENGGGDKVDKR
jgi:hypothetical protein